MRLRPLALAVSALFAVGCGGGGGGGGQAAPPTGGGASPQISTSALPDGTVGQPYAAAVTATGGSAPYTFSILTGSPPSNISISPSGQFSGTPTNPETANFTVGVTDGSGASSTRNLSITVNNAGPGPLTITNSTLPSGSVGQGYSATLTATGGAPPYTWSATGTLPSGLGLDSGTGQISGSPDTPGTYNFTAQVSDAGGGNDSQPFSITINGAPVAGWNVVAVGTGETLYGLDFAGNSGWIVGMNETLLNTTDGGQTWQPQTGGFWTSSTFTQQTGAHILSPPPAWGIYHLLDVHAVDADNIWIASAGPLQGPSPSYGSSSLTPVFRSTNGGATWTRVTIATNFQCWGIHGFSGTSARAATIGSSSHTDSDVFTIEGGADQSKTAVTWGGLRDITFADANTGWTVGDDIYRSTNGGASWSQQSAPGAEYWGVHFASTSQGWAVGSGGTIVTTTNGGQTWTAQTSGVNVTLRDVSFIDTSNGWVVGDGGTVLRTQDGGVTWTAETSGTTNDLHAVKALSMTAAWASGVGGTVLQRQ